MRQGNVAGTKAGVRPGLRRDQQLRCLWRQDENDKGVTIATTTGESDTNRCIRVLHPLVYLTDKGGCTSGI